VAQRLGGGPTALAAARSDVLAVAAALEGHADNAAASVYGGVVATDGARVVPVVTTLDPDVVVWIPEGQATATATSRTALPSTVPFDDAVFNVGRTALLVAALAAGDVDALAAATLDRLHQERRFALVPGSRRVLEAGRAAGAWCGWLSGSGPSVALLTAAGTGTDLAAVIEGSGHTKVLAVDRRGVALVG
jgi:homoserine kinase